jgi:TDG/mug DNA glycosylase family protein
MGVRFRQTLCDALDGAAVSPHLGPVSAAHAGRPTPAEIAAAAGRTVPDVVAPRLRVLFCGINPGLYSAAVGHHFARPGNRFWTVLARAGFTGRLLRPDEEAALLAHGLGITNLVARSTAAADELGADELARGARRLARKARRWRPAFVAVLGVGAYRLAFRRPRAIPGPQREGLGSARLWVLPNPSGRSAAYQLPALTRCFAALARAAGVGAGGRARAGRRLTRARSAASRLRR